ncbi:XRE family transcriptional regulator [Burkholderia savannae]|uniref:XRE family transcriptional regulator n=1 Tax=Burkholderia savannae TaxID=1637837 RepID=UPI0009E70184|nr:XRE family transcriptional regulator [Burkholderia savannae]
MINIATYLASRNLTIDKAAAKAGLSRDRFEQVVGGAKATLGEIRGIAKALKVPLSSLIDNGRAEPIQVLFRKTLDRREVEIVPQVDAVSIQIRDALIIARDVPSNLIWLDAFEGVSWKSEQAEELASIFRDNIAKLDELEPLPNLARILSGVGVFILFSRDSTVDGASAIVDGYAFIILAARSFKPRMLFTIAHELGHLIAHHNVRASGYAHIDREVSSLNFPRRAEEKFADAFASALLLPRAGVLNALKAIREQLAISKKPLGAIEIAWIAHLFHVSFEVAARRFESLDLLNPNGARALCQKIKDDFGNPEKFAASVDIPPRPDLSVETSSALLHTASKMISSGNLSIGKAADLLNVPISALVVANASINV